MEIGGRVAVVTGAGGTMGRAVVEALLAQGCASHNSIDYHRHGIEDALAGVDVADFGHGGHQLPKNDSYVRLNEG